MFPESFDIILLTDQRWVNPVHPDEYASNILLEDALLTKALESHGLNVKRVAWDDAAFDWTTTRYALFRTTWDYFDKQSAFREWLDQTERQTQFINAPATIRWNMDKHYLEDLRVWGFQIPETLFVETGEQRSLEDLVAQCGWPECVLKPAVSGAGRHTYRFKAADAALFEAVYASLITAESLLLQAFQPGVLTNGEAALMVMGGQYTHAVLKRAKEGDFRVQDDFGGTLHPYQPEPNLIAMAEALVRRIQPLPAYARVDIFWNQQQQPCISELELIEPELWLRKHPTAADQLASHIFLTYF